MLNEGVDVPDANVIVFLRNTVSETVFYQQLGRGTRLSPGKAKVKVLDFVANCERIQAVLELKQGLDDFRAQAIVDSGASHGDGVADSREKFTLDIATSEFKVKLVDIIRLLDQTNHRWTRDFVVAALKKWSVDGVMPTSVELDSNPDLPNRRTVLQFFNDMHEAARASNLRVTVKCIIRSDDEMLEGFYRYAVSLGHWPSEKEVETNEEIPCTDTYRTRLGGLAKLRSLCIQKYDCSMLIDRQQWDRDSIIKNFKQLISEKGRRPTIEDIEVCRYLPTYSVCCHITGYALRELYELCHGDELLGITEKTKSSIEPEIIAKLGDMVRLNKRKLACNELKKYNGSPIGYTELRRKGWNMKELNELINADAIIAELNN